MWTCLLVCSPPLETQDSGGPVVLPDSSREEGRGEEREERGWRGGRRGEGGEGGKEREEREERRGRGGRRGEGGEGGEEREGREERRGRGERRGEERMGKKGMCKYRNLHTYVLVLVKDSVRILINSLWCSTLAAVI